MRNRISIVNAQSHKEFRQHADMHIRIDAKAVGKRLEDLLEERKRTHPGETQTSLAREGEISQGALSKVLDGQTYDPGIRLIWAAAVRYKVPVRYILFGGSRKIDDPQDPTEAEAVQLVRDLDPRDRDAWLSAGRSYLSSRRVTSVHESDAIRETSLTRVADAIKGGVKLNAEVVNVTGEGDNGRSSTRPRGEAKAKRKKSRSGPKGMAR